MNSFRVLRSTCTNQIYTTFFNDAGGGHILNWWGEDNCMWSNDFPHVNSTWPKSREVVARESGPFRNSTD